MAKTIIGLFDTFAEARNAVQDIVDMGIPREQVSVVANDARGDLGAVREVGDDDSAASEGAGAGAIGGTIAGGALGLLIGTGLLVIPGIGPVLAAGPLAAAIGSTAAAVGATALGAGIGAAAGGLLGGLIGAGVPEADAHTYTEGVRRGGTLVTIHADDVEADRVRDALLRHGAIDIDRRAAEWRTGGWDTQADMDRTQGGAHVGGDANADWQDSSKAGTATGTVAGAATGAAIGAVGGPVGAVVGGVAGAVTGAAAGAAGDTAGERAEDTLQGERGAARDDAYPGLRHEMGAGERHNVADRAADAATVSGGAFGTTRSGIYERTTAGKAAGDFSASSGAITEPGMVEPDFARGQDAMPPEATPDFARGQREREPIGEPDFARGQDAGRPDVTPDFARGQRTFDQHDHDFRTHHQIAVGSSNTQAYDRYEPAYRFGYDMADDTSLSGDSWHLVEANARQRWEGDRSHGAWDDVKHAVRYAWEKARGLR